MWAIIANPPHPPSDTLLFSPFQQGKGRSNPTLVLIVGWSESYLKYQEVFYDFYQMFDGKINIFAMDHCSQGISGRWSPHVDRGWVADFAHYVDDAEYFVKDVVLNGKKKGKQPLWLLAHSMGGLVATNTISRMPGVFDKVVLSAPMFDVYGLEGVPSPILRFVAFVGDKVSIERTRREYLCEIIGLVGRLPTFTSSPLPLVSLHFKATRKGYRLCSWRWKQGYPPLNAGRRGQRMHLLPG